MEKKDVFYEGDWSDYYVDIDNLPLNKKIERITELDNIDKDIQGRKKSTRSWIGVPIVAVVLIFFSIAINTVFTGIGRYVLMFLLSVITVKILSPMAIKPKNKIKYRWRRWIITVFLWVAFLKGFSIPKSPTHPYGIFTVALMVGIFFIISVIFMFIYIGMSSVGYEEMRTIARKEKDYLYRDALNKINSGRLEPIILEYDVILEHDETPLFETSSVLIDIVETSIYYKTDYEKSNTQNVNVGDWFAKTGFGLNSEVIINDISKIINNVTTEVRRAINTKTRKSKSNNRHYYKIPDKEQEIFDDSAGRLILTNNRILFVGSSKGFQIEYLSLASCTLNRSQKEIISFETTDYVRILATDFSSWIKLYVDRLVTDAREK